MNIALIGYRCSGKTEVGKILAGELGLDFVDSDLLIEEHEGCRIDEMIAEKGWDHFRKIESMMIETVSNRDNLVIATGGGVVLDDGNVKCLHQNGLIVWLKGDAEVLKERMERDPRSEETRPSLTGADPLEEINQMLEIRTPLYRRAGDIAVDTGTLTVREVAGRIIKNLPKKLLR